MEALARPVAMAQHGPAKIRNYQIVGGGILLLVLPLSYVAIKLGLPVESVTAVAALISFIAVLARMYMLRGDFPSWSSRVFMRAVVLRVLLVSAVASIIPFVAHIMIPAGWTNFLAVGSLSLLSSVLCILYLGCDTSERNLILSKCKQGISNFKTKFIH